MGRRDDDEEEMHTTLSSGELPQVDPSRELASCLDDLEVLLKNGDVTAWLTERGVNASLALLAGQGIRAYLVGDKRQAAEDLTAAGEEIRARLALTSGSKDVS